MTASDVTLGSRWYYAGKHFFVVGLTERDGEPAVALSSVGKRSKYNPVVCTRLFLRRAIQSGNHE